MSSGISNGPTPWWQTSPAATGDYNNLTQSAPAGYQYDPVKMGYTPIVGSPTDALAQRARTQGQQDTLFGQEQQQFGQGQNAENRLNAMSGLINSGMPPQPLPGVGAAGMPATSGSTAGLLPVGSGTPDVSSSSSSSGFGGSGFQMPGTASATYGGPASQANSPYTPPAFTPPPTTSATAGPSQGVLNANNNAIYARAKEDAGNTATSAMTGLEGSLAARGMGGAGYEAGEIGGTLAGAANTIGRVSQQNAQNQYTDALSRANQDAQIAASERNADEGAGLTARGQDIGASTALRGQDVSSATSRYGEDLNAGVSQRGQSIGALTNLYDTNANNATAQRGQTLGYNSNLLDSSANNATAQRGQTLNYQTAANGQAIQQQQLALQQLMRLYGSVGY